jgi:hypothetical protein
MAAGDEDSVDVTGGEVALLGHVQRVPAGCARRLAVDGAVARSRAAPSASAAS